MPRPFSVLRLLRLLAFNLGLFLLLIELVALVVWFTRSGQLYYVSPPSGRSVAVDLTGGVEQYRLHPYFGFIARPGSTPGSRANNHGFPVHQDYPRPRRDDEELLVGIYGGSVAENLARFEAEHGLLAQGLGTLLGKDPDKIVVLCFAQGGFKQPQQLLIHSYFRALGQELDVLINIDGFNEVALAARNSRAGVAVEMPSIDHLKALRDVTGSAVALDSVEQMLRVRSSWKHFARWFNRAWSGEGWELRLASGFLVDFVIYKYYLRSYQNGLEAHAEAVGSSTPSMSAPNEPVQNDTWLTLDPAHEPEGAQARARAIEVWSRGALELKRLQDASGGVYLHFIQPNQYVATARRFSEAERAIAFSTESPFAEAARQGYPHLLEAAAALRAQGVAVVDFTTVFDSAAESVYQDDCCHYNDVGQRLLIEAIVEVLVESRLAESASRD